MAVPEPDTEYADHHDHHPDEGDEVAGESRPGSQSGTSRSEVIARVDDCTSGDQGGAGSNKHRSYYYNQLTP